MSAFAPVRFGSAPDGSRVDLVTIENGGMKASLMTWGASLQDLRLGGVDHSLVLGSPDFAPYLGPMRFFGANVGRAANRIAGGRAKLDGRVVELERNEKDRTTLHGGSSGSGTANWRIEGHDGASVRMAIRLADGASGFPGDLDLVVTYRLLDDGALDLEIEGSTDAATFCNPAHHSYWNLDGGPDLSGHVMRVAADRYLPIDADKIPLGAPAPVEGTRFDFRASRSVIRDGDAPLDHNLWLADARGPLKPVCRLEAGGLMLDIATTEPGLQVYDGVNIATGEHTTHSGRPYGRHAGLALEPQCPPDVPNQHGYPSILLMPGQIYRQHSCFHVRRRRQPL